MNFASKLPEVTNISRKFMLRRYKQMMLRGYKKFVLFKFFIAICASIQPCFQFRFNLYFCKAQNLNVKVEIQFTKQSYLHLEVGKGK